MDRQCSSCGGFCKKSGCERENVKPKEWQGLTDEEIRKQYRDSWSLNMMHDFARAIEAKLKEKNQ